MNAVADGLREGIGAFVVLIGPWVLAALITGEWRRWK